MTDKQANSKELRDGVPYDEVYYGINSLFSETAEKTCEGDPMSWDKAELVRFFKRLGSVPAKLQPSQSLAQSLTGRPNNG